MFHVAIASVALLETDRHADFTCPGISRVYSWSYRYPNPLGNIMMLRPAFQNGSCRDLHVHTIVEAIIQAAAFQSVNIYTSGKMLDRPLG